MNEGTGTSRAGVIGLAVLGAVVLVALLVQNVWQGRAITALESEVTALRTSMVEGRRADGLAALGSLSSMPSSAKSTRPKKGKRSGTARSGPKRGDRVARDPLAEGGAKGGKAGKAGKRREGAAGAPDLDDEEGAATP